MGEIAVRCMMDCVQDARDEWLLDHLAMSFLPLAGVRAQIQR